MKVKLHLSLFLAAFLLLFSQAALSLADTETSDKGSAELASILESYCTDCHDDDKQKGDFNLMKLIKSKKPDMNHWQTVYYQVLDGVMPPATTDQPSAKEKKLILSAIKKMAGRNVEVSNRTLTPAEIKNSLYDLLDAESAIFDPTVILQSNYG